MKRVKEYRQAMDGIAACGGWVRAVDFANNHSRVLFWVDRIKDVILANAKTTAPGCRVALEYDQAPGDEGDQAVLRIEVTMDLPCYDEPTLAFPMTTVARETVVLRGHDLTSICGRIRTMYRFLSRIRSTIYASEKTREA